MNIRNQREKDVSTKQEGRSDHKAAPPSSSRLWSGLKNPRIVRVSRAFGGKDRHSKVSTVRGLRDRRVRLSVPTAIQLYDLQDRLGLNQPSKVVDWLINASQHEIDKLPPLQLPPEGFIQFSSQSHDQTPDLPQPPPSDPPPTAKGFGYTTNEHNGEGPVTSFSRSAHWNSDSPQRSEQREGEDPKVELLKEKGNTIKGNGLVSSAQVLSHETTLHRSNHSGFVGNTMMPHASYFQWEAANAYLSHLGIRSSHSDQAPIMSIPEPQLVFCPPGIVPSIFPSNLATPTDFNAKYFAQLQTPQSNLDINSRHLGSPSARPFQ